jgi:hypothetical protein
VSAQLNLPLYCPECHCSEAIHDWSTPTYPFPCPRGSWERDRAAFAESVKAGDVSRLSLSAAGDSYVESRWTYTRVAYSRTLDEKPAWFKGHVMRTDFVRSNFANCYGVIWYEERRER